MTNAIFHKNLIRVAFWYRPNAIFELEKFNFFSVQYNYPVANKHKLDFYLHKHCPHDQLQASIYVHVDKGADVGLTHGNRDDPICQYNHLLAV